MPGHSLADRSASAATTIGGVTQTGVHITRWLKLPRRCSKYASPPASTAKTADVSAMPRWNSPCAISRAKPLQRSVVAR